VGLDTPRQRHDNRRCVAQDGTGMAQPLKKRSKWEVICGDGKV
jgi:hypothetical protein